MTSTEFVDWMVFEQMEREKSLSNPTLDHYYLANIVMAIQALFHKNPKSLKLENYLLKFSGSEKKVDPKVEAEKSKSIWAAFANRFGFRKREPVDQSAVPFIREPGDGH